MCGFIWSGPRWCKRPWRGGQGNTIAQKRPTTQPLQTVVYDGDIGVGTRGQADELAARTI
jgi:hypothetical protein